MNATDTIPNELPTVAMRQALEALKLMVGADRRALSKGRTSQQRFDSWVQAFSISNSKATSEAVLAAAICLLSESSFEKEGNENERN